MAAAEAAAFPRFGPQGYVLGLGTRKWDARRVPVRSWRAPSRCGGGSTRCRGGLARFSLFCRYGPRLHGKGARRSLRPRGCRVCVDEYSRTCTNLR
ncbi:hypothetical protein MTP99_014816 [Tenebrio molitor]|nr:hypothetical protein MTP99_014816 [Tenebrio molitor]